MSSKKLSLTLKDRIVLRNQFLILASLLPKEADFYSEAAEILEDGYELEYARFTEAFSDPFSADECREVHDILNMFRMIDNCVRENGDLGIATRLLTFQGFDGNEETRQYAYAKFLIEDQKRWTGVQQR